ncbi:MAG TPA: hypothetical protein VN958_05765, partial [Chitinophagaceae bacterium]|nr:hypothetical protein [Chitinophagaceae bacterium]
KVRGVNSLQVFFNSDKIIIKSSLPVQKRSNCIRVTQQATPFVLKLVTKRNTQCSMDFST